MRARVICAVTIFFAMAVATAVGNPLPEYVLGSFIPGVDGEISIIGRFDGPSSYAVVNGVTVYSDSVFIRDLPLSPFDSFYCEVSRIPTGDFFPDSGANITIFIDGSIFQSFSYGLNPVVEDGSFNFKPWFWHNQIPCAPGGYYWRTGFSKYWGGLSPYEIITTFDLETTPIDYSRSIETGTDVYSTSDLRIQEVKPFGGDRFIELGKNDDDSLCLDGWRLLADGFHTFTETDTIIDCLALFEADWDSGFSISDTCQLILLSPNLTALLSVSWYPWPDTSLAACILNEIDPTTGYYREILATPTPGVPPSAIDEIPSAKLPAAVAIHSAQPNPFNDAASIGYEFAHGVTEAEIAVFDILGREVLSRKLSDTRPGYHETKIATLPASGTYLVRIETNRGSDEMKITFLK